MYDSSDEATMRIDRSIIQGPDGPVFVKGIQSKNRFRYSKFNKKGGLSAQDFDGDFREGVFSPKAFRLGYINWNGRAVYLQRMPVRKYKQGLSTTSLHAADNMGQERGRYEKADLLFEGTGFLKMYKDEYPTFEACIDLIEDMGMHSAAFSREWSVGGTIEDDMGLWYKSGPVGEVSEEGAVELWEHRKYLTEALREVMV